MKVVHAYKIYRPDADGGIPQVIHMLTGTENSELSNQILVARNRGLSRRYKLDGISVRAVAAIASVFSTPLAPSYPFAIRKLGMEADVIVHHAPFPLTDIGLLFGLRDTTALVVYWHAEVVGRSLLLKLLAPVIRATLRRADRIIVSDKAMLAASPFLKPYESKCVIVPYGLDINYWSTLSQAEQEKVNELRLEFPRLIVTVGRLVSYKGFNVLLDALKEVDAQLVIIGEGPLYENLKDLATRNGVGHRVFLKGRVKSEEIKQYIHASRVFVLPSITEAEAFGLVQVEAMAAGRAVINTNLPTAVPHVARHNFEAITVPASDPSALAFAIDTVLSDPQLAEKLGRSGQVRARAEFTREIYRERVERVFAEAMRSRRGS